MTTDLTTSLVQIADTKIVMYVFDGLGGLPNSRGRTELEDADTRHLDRMAEQGSLGQLIPVAPMVTPGPATAFLALLGYDPLTTSLDEGAELQPFPERWQMKAALLASSETHVALGRRAGLDVVEQSGGPSTLVDAMTERWDDYDCFIVHCSVGLPEAGRARFAAKRSAIAAFDLAVPGIVQLKPDVLLIMGDRTSPAMTGIDSWHPAPLLVTGSHALPDETHRFSELGCARGVLGTILAREVMSLAMAHAGRLGPFGV